MAMLKFFTKEVIKPFPVPGYIVFNVDNFNRWFNDPNNNAVYSNPGIFLRLDKFGVSQVMDYLEKCYGINSVDVLGSGEILKFSDEIKKDWKQKIADGNARVKSDLKNGL